jgi:glycosyltransferase involved in cell wall biosynthesis
VASPPRYFPSLGGVADHSEHLAKGLRTAGDDAVVFAPAPAAARTSEDKNVVAIPEMFLPAGLSKLADLISELPRPRRVLVQYVAQSFGMRSMNLFAATRLAKLGRSEAVDVLFHEVAVIREEGDPLKHLLLEVVTKRMAAMVAEPAARVFVTTPAWVDRLRACGCTRNDIRELPVPSNVVMPTSSDERTNVRSSLAPALPNDGLLIGHFGTFGPYFIDAISRCLAPMLEAQPSLGGLLIGKGSRGALAGIVEQRPNLAGRLHASGDLPMEELGDWIAACDIMFQPYPDGITGRRTSAMAGLKLGRPVVTTRGYLTEPFWEESGAVALGSSLDASVTLLDELLANPQRRAELAQEADRFYSERFSMEHAVATLRQGIA